MQEPQHETPIEAPKKASRYVHMTAKILPKHKAKLKQIMKMNRLDNLSQALRFMLDEAKF